MRKFIKAGLCGLTAAMLVCGGCSAKTENSPSAQEENAETKSGAESGAQDGETSAEDGATEEYIAEGSITLGDYKRR